MQRAYMNALFEIMRMDPQVVSLLSDSGTDYDALMARDMPSQCYNFGIAEQNQVGVAAGMALCGKIPFVYTSGAFLAYRSYEFIRNDICYQNQNVKLVGMGSGMSWHTLGVSHHTTEDLSALRALPNLTILTPATPLEARLCTIAAYEHQGPVYIRLGMSGEAEFYREDFQLRIGGSACLKQGADVAIFTSGSILSEVMEAADQLFACGIQASVIDLYAVKPVDAGAILTAASNHSALVTVEEHNIVGGVGSIVAEILVEAQGAKPLLRIGLMDTFAKGYGTQKEVRIQNGLDSQAIAQKVTGFMQHAAKQAAR